VESAYRAPVRGHVASEHRDGPSLPAGGVFCSPQTRATPLSRGLKQACGSDPGLTKSRARRVAGVDARERLVGPRFARLAISPPDKGSGPIVPADSNSRLTWGCLLGKMKSAAAPVSARPSPRSTKKYRGETSGTVANYIPEFGPSPIRTGSASASSRSTGCPSRLATRRSPSASRSISKAVSYSDRPWRTTGAKRVLAKVGVEPTRPRRSTRSSSTRPRTGPSIRWSTRGAIATAGPDRRQGLLRPGSNGCWPCFGRYAGRDVHVDNAIFMSGAERPATGNRRGSPHLDAQLRHDPRPALNETLELYFPAMLRDRELARDPGPSWGSDACQRGC